MKKTLLILFIIAVALVFATATDIHAEIVYTKDGQVIKGTVVNEDAAAIYVRTRYQVRRVRRDNIRRILYGDRDMEKIHIILKDGSTLSGYLIDQDAKNVYYREKPDSPREKIISKETIRQMSREEIIPFEAALSVRAGMFFPMNTKGADLQSSPILLASYEFNLPWIRRARMAFEAGYVRCPGNDNDEEYLQLIPITANLSYSVPVGMIAVIPRIGAGIAAVEFNNGEGETFRGYDLYFSGGLGVRYEILKRKLAVSLWGEYALIVEGSEQMGNVIASLMLSYYF